MRIPENKIEEVRSAINIVDVISDRIQLRKRGKNYLGLCPFHNEKTPSFTVSEEKQIYHCFGCHAGGNVFKFIMEYEKISFVESVQELAQQFGISIEYEEQHDEGRQSEQEILYDINTAAARYFSNNLLNSDEGEIARVYFENRKLKPQILRSFGLGYSFDNKNSLIDYLLEKKIDLEKAIDLGLIGKFRDGKLYNKFSGRIIFPIFSPNGRVVAFAGRILGNREGVAKYLNSPESSIYTKGRILYGLSHAKDDIRRADKAILVEGYMDLISLHQSGIKNVVAVSGTALTDEQVQLLSRYTKNVVLLFDADTAGIKASMRSIEILLKKNIEIKIASLPAGEDPDSFVNNFGKERFEEEIERAKNFLEYQSEYFKNLGMFDDPAKTADAIRELVKPIALIDDELKRQLLIKSIAKQFNLREKLLEAELEKAIGKTKKQSFAQSRIMEAKDNENEVLDISEKKIIHPELLAVEKELIALLFQGILEVIGLIRHYILLEEYQINIHRELAEIVYNAYDNEEDILPSALFQKITENTHQLYLSELSSDKYSISSRWEKLHPGEPKVIILRKQTEEAIKIFKQRYLDIEIEENTKKITRIKDDAELLQLMEIDRELKYEKKVIQESQISLN